MKCYKLTVLYNKYLYEILVNYILIKYGSQITVNNLSEIIEMKENCELY